MGYIDIIIYAVIAVVLFARLWTLFGRRSDEDQQRPNPFAAPPPSLHDDEEPVLLPGRNATAGETSEAAPVPFAPLRAAPASLLGGLEQIGQFDPSFDEKQFLQGTRQAFAMIVEDFARGDLARSLRLLGPQVAKRFQDAIAARQKAGETAESKIARIKETEVSAARVENGRALLTVRIVSDQENILRNKTGAVVSGTPGKAEEITDIWVFARDAKSPDPNWQLIETRPA